MEKKIIVTISRQYGSGGREIGRRLAQSLGIPFYDKELISMAAKESGYAEELFDKADSQATNSLLYSLSLYSTTMGLYDMPLNDKLYIVQSETIRKVAAQGSCVIVGRCADYVLREDPDVINIFIHSDMENKIRRAVEEYDLPKEGIVEYITKTDKKRATYYNYYTGLKWGRAENYHLTLRTDTVGLDAAVETIKAFVNAHHRKDGE